MSVELRAVLTALLTASLHTQDATDHVTITATKVVYWPKLLGKTYTLTHSTIGYIKLTLAVKKLV